MYLNDPKNIILYLVANKKKLILGLVILLLILGNIVFATAYIFQVVKTQEAQKELKAKKTNEKVVNFLNLFIQKVLKTDQPVSFEDRLQLENSVRDINDSEILSKWEQFTGGTNEFQIQQGVKDLLEALVKKISY